MNLTRRADTMNIVQNHRVENKALSKRLNKPTYPLSPTHNISSAVLAHYVLHTITTIYATILPFFYVNILPESSPPYHFSFTHISCSVMLKM